MPEAIPPKAQPDLFFTLPTAIYHILPTPMSDFNNHNAHQRDALLSFDAADHVYTHNGRTLRSVTNFVEDCFEKFDADYWAPKLALKYGISEQELKAQWDAKSENARRLGTLLHAKIEHHYLGQPQETDETFRLFEQFSDQYRLNPYRTEWAIYDEEMGIAGTLDFLDYSDGTFTIYDWKRTDKIIENGRPVITNRYNKTALPPISSIPDTTFWHYALQVSIYRYILERNYGINVQAGKLAIFHPSYDTYHVVEVPYLKEEIKLLFPQTK